MNAGVRAATATHQAQLPLPEPFDLTLAVFGHGWIDLEPNAFDPKRQEYSTALPTHGGVADLRVRSGQRSLRLEITAPARLTTTEVARCRGTVARSLRLDEDLTEFWRVCRAVPRLRWVARRGAGRMLRGATLFEDLLKLLFTTNCSWAATRGMTTRLVQALGEPAPSGRRAFPNAAQCATADEAFFRSVVRAGYRAKACVALARAFASGQLTEATFAQPDLPTVEVRRRLLALSGFGPYAAGQALRLLGRHEDLALDSWCRGRLAELRKRKQPPSDAAVARAYRGFGRYQGLVLWMDLTADWHCSNRRLPWEAS